MRTPDKNTLENCDTLMLDMDGTLLDLAYDNHLWTEVVPSEYARQRAMPEQEAREQLFAKMLALRGTLDWYCLDFWSEQLELDILGLHREQNHRIGFLPGAEGFLEQVASSQLQVLLVTNSHRSTLDLKNEVTGLSRHFDGIHTSHDLGHPKEDQPFWLHLQEEVGFDPETTLFVDDNVAVLNSANMFGIRHLVAVAEPDSSAPAQQVDDYPAVDRVARLAPQTAD